MTSSSTSPFRAIKTRLNSIQTVTNNGHDLKSSRVSVKKPSSSTNSLTNGSSTNGFTNQVKKRTLLLNNFFNSKSKSIDYPNGCQSSKQIQFLPTSPDPPTISEESNDLTQSVDTTQELEKNCFSKPMEKSTKIGSSICSDAENQIICSPDRSSNDTDADESDHGQKEKSTKSRRLQKTRKSNISAMPNKADHRNHTPPLLRSTHPRKDEQQRSSSNDDDDENQESISRLNESNSNNRRFKPSSSKKVSYFSPVTTITTTTDEDISKQSNLHQPIERLGSKSVTAESNPPSPIPTMTAPVRKVNRFQVKQIRKSQQPHLLLASITAAKSSNDEDCSVPNGLSDSQMTPAIIQRDNSNTPTTDRDDSVPRKNGFIKEHHVRFQGASNDRTDLLVEEDKSPAPSNTNPIQATSNSLSSSAKIHGEDDEEEAVAKSPDHRFIKYAKEIGRGAFKTVYRGLDTETSVAVAWCELQDFAQFDKHERARFKEEAEMLKKLQHPNIVRFYDFWEETNPRTNKKVIILVTELMTSGSLKSYIKKFRGQKEEKRINVMKKWCRQILKGLAYLHSRNPPVIHRDLKCDNVFVSSTTGSVKIGDLGLATFKTQTFAKSMRGTMEFMAPEMFDEKYDELVDIYSFGLCMLEMITGEYPYIECKGPTAVMKRVIAGLKPDCYYKLENEDVREVIDCCIRTKKEERLPVHELLQHSFFLDENGLRLDIVRDSSNDAEIMSNNESIDFKLKIVEKNKRKALWTEHEAIRFRYNLNNDTPEQIADELIQKKYIFEEDKKFVTQSITDRLRAYRYEQIDRKAGVFSRDGKLTNNQTPQAVPIIPPQQQQLLPSQPTTPIVVQPSNASLPAVTPTPSLIQSSPVDIQQVSIIKAATEIAPPKSVINTEPIPITPLSDLSSNVSGSAGSLEILDAALKKTFNKTNVLQGGTTTTSTTINDSTDPTLSQSNQDEPLILKSTNNLNSIHPEHQTIEESTEVHITDPAVNALQSSTAITLQSQSQPTTMLTSHQHQLLNNSLLSTQAPQSFSYTNVASSQPFLPTTLTTDAVKQIIPCSSSSTTAEAVENSHAPPSLSQTNETISPSILSDPPITNQPQIPGSLKQLDVLLKHTFKNASKSTGTPQNSDTESTVSSNPIVPLATTTSLATDAESISNDASMKVDDGRRKLLDLFKSTSSSGSTMIHSQPSTATVIVPPLLQQPKSQPTIIQLPLQFDPLISPERTVHQPESAAKTPNEKSSSNDDTIVASSTSSSDIMDIKSMIMDLSKTLLNKMTVIERKIDEHRQQTEKVNDLLTQTVLPSLIDISEIINETSANLNPQVRAKLESIRENIRRTQEKQSCEVKDLMEM